VSDAYRDPLAGLRAQIEAKRVSTRELEKGLRPVRRRLLDPSTRSMLDELARAASANADTIEGLTRIDAKIDEWQDALRAAINKSNALVDVSPEPFWPEAPAPKSGAPLGGLDFLREVLANQTGTTPVAWGSEGFATVFEDGGVNFLLVADAFPTMRRDTLEVGHVALGLRMGLSGLRGFVVAPIAHISTYRKKIEIAQRKKRDAVPVTFDELFELRGDAEIARLLLDKDARDAFLDLNDGCVPEPPAQRRFPSIVVREGHVDGYVEVAWTRLWELPPTDEPTDLLLGAGIDVLQGFRRALGA
jgi:hypothetical protein